MQHCMASHSKQITEITVNRKLSNVEKVNFRPFSLTTDDAHELFVFLVKAQSYDNKYFLFKIVFIIYNVSW